MLIREKDTILFQGDSITDAGRTDSENPAVSLGMVGYVAMIADALKKRFSQRNLTVINRGIGGHRVRDLRARWQADCIDVKPDILTIYVGINDTWRRYDSNSITTAEEFKRDYGHIIAGAKQAGIRDIILMAPFVLPFPDDRKAWREDLDPKIIAVRELAVEFGCKYIDLDGMFAEAYAEKPEGYYAADGVHPSAEGAKLIMNKWLSIAL